MNAKNSNLMLRMLLEDLEKEHQCIPSGSQELLVRLFDDLRYCGQIKEDNLTHFKQYYSHLFEAKERGEQVKKK